MTSLPQSQHAGLLHRLAHTRKPRPPPSPSCAAYTKTRASCRRAVPQRCHRTRGTDSSLLTGPGGGSHGALRRARHCGALGLRRARQQRQPLEACGHRAARDQDAGRGRLFGIHRRAQGPGRRQSDSFGRRATPRRTSRKSGATRRKSSCCSRAPTTGPRASRPVSRSWGRAA
ncbi:hypothetical protein B0H15DRAFT_311912 [Mycena belliarum]|uniref:Uncharacterized protein n=1 Tax=Mycena belliarum TaxID=1033014 RepID=A0AAD6UFN4_9AGAR|nr:hypothetical protein B0H15DRAFT_311912 [Mycena belliae]